MRGARNRFQIRAGCAFTHDAHETRGLRTHLRTWQSERAARAKNAGRARCRSTRMQSHKCERTRQPK
eukprot:5969075-Lingulodinium_polyedra.AAC.1